MVDTEMINLKVKIANSSQEIDLKISLNDSVEELSNKVIVELGISGKYVRLVCAGKLLQPPTALLSNFNIFDGCCIHAAISDRSPSAQFLQSSSAISPPRTVDLSNLRGFDRLLNDGLNMDEVATIRAAFQPQLDTLAASIPRQQDETNENFRLRIEDLWMLSQGSFSEFNYNVRRPRTDIGHPQDSDSTSFISTNNTNFLNEEENVPLGSEQDFLLGVIMGSFVGMIIIFCIWDRNVSHRSRMGMLVGIGLNILLGYIFTKRN